MLDTYYERILVIDPKLTSEGDSLLANQFMSLSHVLPLLLQKVGYYDHKLDDVIDTSNEVWLVRVIDSSLIPIKKDS